MLSRILLASILLMTIGLAGCASDDGGTPSVPGAGTEGGDGASEGNTQNGTGSTPSQSAGPGGDDPAVSEDNNTLPLLAVAADVSAGIVPFNVTFTINGTDADGDPLAWKAEENGTEVGAGDEVPGTMTVTVTTPGNHTFIFTLTDGKANVTGNFTVVAGADAVPAGPQQVELITGAWKTGVGTNAAPLAYILCSGPEDGHTIKTFPLDTMYTGRTFTATVKDASGGAALDSWRIIFNSPGCGVDTKAYGTGDGGGGAALEGAIPDGYDFGFFTSVGGVNLEATLLVFA